MVPKPIFWIFRPGSERITGAGELIRQPGCVVPLIPADLLPPWVEIIGVPRRMAQDRADGLKIVGSFHMENEGYELKFLRDEEPEKPALPDDDADTDASTLYATSEPSDTSAKAKEQTPIAVPSPTTPRPPLHPAKGLEASRHNPLNATPPSSTPPSASEAAPIAAAMTAAMPTNSFATAALAKAEPKRFCRHWCHHGTCKWGISCRFQHKMPMTEAELCSVGLIDFPPWWIAANQMAFKAHVAEKKQQQKQQQQQQQQQQQHQQQQQQQAEDEVIVISGGGVVALKKSGKKKKNNNNNNNNQRPKPGKANTSMLRLLLKAQEKSDAQSAVEDADDEREVGTRKEEECLIDV